MLSSTALSAFDRLWPNDELIGKVKHILEKVETDEEKWHMTNVEEAIAVMKRNQECIYINRVKRRFYKFLKIKAYYQKYDADVDEKGSVEWLRSVGVHFMDTDYGMQK